MRIRPILWVSVRPMCSQDLPWSKERYIPVPAYEERLELFSPVPIQITSPRPQSTAISPSTIEASSSNNDSKDSPLVLLRHNPPEAYATYISVGSRGLASMSTIRPLITVGPIPSSFTFDKGEDCASFRRCSKLLSRSATGVGSTGDSISGTCATQMCTPKRRRKDPNRPLCM